MGCINSKSKNIEKNIEKYIKTTVKWRNNHGSKMNLSKQLKKKRVEVIMVGKFLLDNSKLKIPKYEILFIDSKLPGSEKNFRPDLIIKNKSIMEIIHIEIDEFDHTNYSKSNELERNKFIENYFKINYPRYNYKRLRFNPNVFTNKLDMAKSFSKILMNQDIISEVKKIKPI